MTRLLAKNGLSGLDSQAASRTRRSWALRVVEHRSAQGLGLHRLAGSRLADVARAGGVDDLLVGQVALLPADLREEGGKPVIIVLSPALERVIVALGALDSHAEEKLGGRLDGRLRVAADPIVVRRGIAKRRALGGQQGADKLVHRNVAFERFANPAMEGISPLGLDQPAVGAEDVGKLERPEVVELRPHEQPVDDVIAPLSSGRSARNALTSSGVGKTPSTSR